MCAKDMGGIGTHRGRNYKECPTEQGRNYTLYNYTPDTSKYPPLIPNGRYKVDMEATCDSFDLWSVYVLFEISRPIKSTYRLLQITYQYYKFASNEYRLYPIRFQVLMCDRYDQDFGGFGSFTKCKNFKGCPYEKERNYTVCNYKPDSSKFPPLVPSGRYKIEAEGTYGSTQLWNSYLLIEITRPIV
ncbi:hypothetical protein ILUMI_05321 [Ignelater luminosus]|uniref:Uncharacterized protein n=1 Tax=Ignelater luminosus TaxID=2038154 RepID=A0A8K0DD63_IGNLU|nr:hypothetical protein ILUMI_05321 [Ignelater luminosus]